METNFEFFFKFPLNFVVSLISINFHFFATSKYFVLTSTNKCTRHTYCQKQLIQSCLSFDLTFTVVQKQAL